MPNECDSDGDIRRSAIYHPDSENKEVGKTTITTAMGRNSYVTKVVAFVRSDRAVFIATDAAVPRVPPSYEIHIRAVKSGSIKTGRTEASMSKLKTIVTIQYFVLQMSENA